MQNVSLRTDNGSAGHVSDFYGTDEEGNKMNHMSKSNSYSRFLTWFMALTVSALVAGCGGGGGGQDPILGGAGATVAPAPAPPAPPVSPTVTSTAPANKDTGVATNAKINADFSETMDAPSIVTPATAFTLTGPGTTAVPGTVTYTGVSAKFTPTSLPLAINTTYTATISTAAKSAAGGALASDYVWTFTTGAVADTTAPTVTSTGAANGATGLAINRVGTAIFSEAMDPETINATTVTVTTGGVAVPGTVSYIGTTATFTPAANLATNTVYTSTVTTGAQDLAGNALAANHVVTWTTGATADTTAPTVSSTGAANGATGVPINRNSSAIFSEQMNALTITTTSYTVTGPGATPVAGTVSYAGTTATFNPASNLAANTTYTSTITTAAKDLAGNALAANYVWSWTTSATADTTAPTVSSTGVANGATGVPINRNSTAIFSEQMNPLTINTATYTVTGPGATPVAGAVTYAGTTATFNPTVDLAANTTYTSTITTGAKDLAGNALAANYVWSWTTAATADTTKPTVTSTVPANAAIGVAIGGNLAASFSEAMDPLTVSTASFSLAQGATPVAGAVSYVGTTATFNPTAALAANTLYTATISTAVEDLAGNAMASNYVWSFTTGATPDTTAPTVLSTNPADVAIGICMNKTVNATFSEAMDPLTITTDTIALAVTVGGAAVTGVVTYDSATNIASFNPSANLTANISYTVTIKGGTGGVKDLAGNALAADKVTSFTTNASLCTTAPALGAAAPFGGFGGNATLTSDGLGTVIDGDIGVNAASTKITGLRDSGGNVYTVTTSNDGTVNGLVYTLTAPPGSVAGAAVTQARADALVAFNSISPASLPGGIDVSSLAQCPSCGGAGQGPGQLAGRTLPPGVYMSTTGTYGIGITVPTAGNLTLDAGGDANAVWVFQTAAVTGTLTVGVTGPATPATPIQVLLVNGAQAKNVFWYVPSGATIGTGATMVGTLLADASITLSTTGGGPPPDAVTTTLNGRAIALTAGVTMTNTVINVPAQ